MLNTADGWPIAGFVIADSRKMSVALLVALALGAHDNRVPGGANYCLPWTTEGAAPAGVASALSCLAQCEATTWCVAITWYANPPALYPDGCYLFRSCGRLARSQYGGRVWYRYGNPSAPPSPLPPPPSPLPPPSLPPPLPPPPWELFSYKEKVTIICSLVFICGAAFFAFFYFNRDEQCAARQEAAEAASQTSNWWQSNETNGAYPSYETSSVTQANAYRTRPRRAARQEAAEAAWSPFRPRRAARNPPASRDPRVSPDDNLEAGVEQSVQSAIELLPCQVWGEADAKASGLEEEDDDRGMCSLCLCNYEAGDEVTRLTCGHAFHKACVTRWLGEAQRGKKRRCPLCNLDPLAAVTIVTTTPPATPSSSSRSAPTTPEVEVEV